VERGGGEEGRQKLRKRSSEVRGQKRPEKNFGQRRSDAEKQGGILGSKKKRGHWKDHARGLTSQRERKRPGGWNSMGQLRQRRNEVRGSKDHLATSGIEEERAGARPRGRRGNARGQKRAGGNFGQGKVRQGGT